jgi:hypothetical protein
VALFNDYEGGRSSAAELESHNPYFDSSNVSCTATSCEDDEVVSLDGSCSLSVTSIRLDPEVDALNNVYCEFNLVGGKVYVGLNDGSCTPSESTLDYEVCGGAGSCSGSFYYSITKDMLYDNRPTYLVLVVERSCTYPTCDAATFYVKGIKPEWIDVGIATEGGGMSEDSCGNWEFTGESCTDTTESESQTSAGGGMSGMNNVGTMASGGGYVPVGLGGSGAPSDRLVIGGQLPDSGTITLNYNAATPGQDFPEGTSLQIYTSTGVFVPDGQVFTITNHQLYMNTTPVVDSFKVTGLQKGLVSTTQDVKTTLTEHGTDVCISTVHLTPMPDIIIMPGLGDTGKEGMTQIAQRIAGTPEDSGDPQIATFGGSVSVAIEEATDEVYDEIRWIADYNQVAEGNHTQGIPLVLIGFSDGATEIRNFAWQMKTDYPENRIDYVGMIDLVRTNAYVFRHPWDGTPDWSHESVDMPNTIRAGDNYYQNSYFYDHGHKLVGCSKIQNYDISDITWAYPPPDHWEMPYIELIQHDIADHAARAYLTALHVV